MIRKLPSFLSGSKAVYGGRVSSFEEENAGSGKSCSAILGLIKIDWRPKDELDMLSCLLKKVHKGGEVDVSQYLNRRGVRLPGPQDLQINGQLFQKIPNRPPVGRK